MLPSWLVLHDRKWRLQLLHLWMNIRRTMYSTKIQHRRFTRCKQWWHSICVSKNLFKETCKQLHSEHRNYSIYAKNWNMVDTFPLMLNHFCSIRWAQYFDFAYCRGQFNQLSVLFSPTLVDYTQTVNLQII